MIRNVTVQIEFDGGYFRPKADTIVSVIGNLDSVKNVKLIKWGEAKTVKPKKKKKA